MKDSSPLLCMNQCIKSLRQRKVFSTLDAYSGYRKINIEKKFDLRQRLYTFQNLPVHSNAFQPYGPTASFQSTFDDVLSTEGKCASPIFMTSPLTRNQSKNTWFVSTSSFTALNRQALSSKSRDVGSPRTKSSIWDILAGLGNSKLIMHAPCFSRKLFLPRTNRNHAPS